MQKDGFNRRRLLQGLAGMAAVASGVPPGRAVPGETVARGGRLASLGPADGRVAVAASSAAVPASTPVKGANAMSQPTNFFAYVGSRTTRERNARGEGINVYRVDARTGQWSHVQLVTGLANPSFLAFDRTKRFLYTVHGDLTDISAFAIDPRSGKLTHLNSVSTFGKNPVHLTVDPTNRWIVVVNHLSSTLVVLARNPDGSLGGRVDEAKLTGRIG